MKKITSHGLTGKTYEVDPKDLIWRPSAYGILIKDNKILVSKQWDGYDLPGGGVDLNETLEQGVIREVWEETGLEGEVIDIIHSQTTFFTPDHSPKHKGEHWNCPLSYFLVKQTGGELSIDNFDDEEQDYAEMAEWMPLEQVSCSKFINSVDTPMVVNKALKYIKLYEI
jgi:8-oxo-dGTP diphosphatase